MKLLILSACAILVPAIGLVATLRAAAKHDQPIQKPVEKPMRMPDGFPIRMADIIWIVEGKEVADYPYGVKNHGKLTPDKARAITIRSVCNNWTRWTTAGQPGGFPRGFAEIMADRWCPEKTDPEGHTNWIRNVCWFLEHEK